MQNLHQSKDSNWNFLVLPKALYVNLKKSKIASFKTLQRIREKCRNHSQSIYPERVAAITKRFEQYCSEKKQAISRS